MRLKERLKEAYRIVAEEIFTDESGKFWGNEGAGGVFYAKDTGRICLQLRSPDVNEPNTWGTWGGAIERGESPEEGMAREIEEETGFSGHYDLKPLYVYTSGKFRFHNYLITVDQEFAPRHSWETSDHVWCELDDLPSPLHFGMKGLLPHLEKALA